LLAEAPVGSDSGRNTWLTQVSGHYARLFLQWDDYVAHVSMVNAGLGAPLAVDEVRRVAASIWRTEQAGRDRQANEQEHRRAVKRRMALLRVDAEAKELLRASEFTPPPTTLDLVEELAQPDPKVRWAVDELVPDVGNVLLAAAYKIGKTTLVLNLVKALAEGKPFLQFAATHLEGRVAVWNREMAAAMYRDWLRRTEIANPQRVSVLHLKGESTLSPAPRGSSGPSSGCASAGSGSGSWTPTVPCLRATTKTTIPRFVGS
jgi:hypothetical protein